MKNIDENMIEHAEFTKSEKMADLATGSSLHYPHFFLSQGYTAHMDAHTRHYRGRKI